MCVIVVFWYCILMSSNTPQNLETPILGSKIKRLLSSLQVSASGCGLAYRRISDHDALPTTPQWNQSNRRETCAYCVKSQKKARETRYLTSPLRCQKRLQPGLQNSSRKLLLTVKQTMSHKLQYPVLLWKAILSTTYSERRPPQESCSQVEAPYCVRVGLIRSGKLLSLVWGTVPAVGEALLKQPQALCVW